MNKNLCLFLLVFVLFIDIFNLDDLVGLLLIWLG